MNPVTHLLLSVIPAGILAYFNWTGGLIFLLVSVLIDVDHYPVFVIKFKSISLKKAYNYFKTINDCNDVAVFHTLEVLLFFFILSFFYPILFYVVGALAFHMAIDLYEMKTENKSRFFSFTSWIWSKL